MGDGSEALATQNPRGQQTSTGPGEKTPLQGALKDAQRRAPRADNYHTTWNAMRVLHNSAGAFRAPEVLKL